MSFSISVIKNPIEIWDERRKCKVINWDESAGDHNLDFDLNYEEFYALQKLLDVKLPSVNRREGESSAERDERFKDEYLNAASKKGFEMFGRFWYEFADVIYFSSEINRLREEGLKAKEKSSDVVLISAADKIIKAVDEALKTESGLFFGCD